MTTVCSEDGGISIFKLRNIGILWCEGDPIEKASELFENMQDSNAATIACNDKDFKPNLYALINFATQMVFEEEVKYMPSVEREYTDEAIEKIQDKYDDLADDFLDEVFDAESRLTRKEWEELVSKK